MINARVRPGQGRDANVLSIDADPDADRAQRVLLISTLAVFVGITFAVVISTFRPAFSSLEGALIRLAWPVTGGCLVILFLSGARYLREVALTLCVSYSAFILFNLGYQALSGGSLLLRLMYAVWLPMHYVFIVMVLPHRSAVIWSWCVCVVSVALLACSGANLSAELLRGVEGTLLASVILVQPFTVLMLQSMSCYRNHYARVAAEAPATREAALQTEAP